MRKHIIGSNRETDRSWNMKGDYNLKIKKTITH